MICLTCPSILGTQIWNLKRFFISKIGGRPFWLCSEAPMRPCTTFLGPSIFASANGSPPHFNRHPMGSLASSPAYVSASSGREPHLQVCLTMPLFSTRPFLCTRNSSGGVAQEIVWRIFKRKACRGPTSRGESVYLEISVVLSSRLPVGAIIKLT